MTELVRVEDHTQQALELLIDAYKGLPRLSGLIASFTNRIQEFEDINWDVLNKRLLDYTDRNGNPAHAAGAQLDVIGRLVGRGRNGQDDATYLVYIRAQIFLNKSRALRGDVVTLLQLIESASFTYTEYYPCEIVVEYAAPTAASPLVLQELAQRCVTGGVHLFIIEQAEAESDAFLFGDDTVGGQVDAAHGLADDLGNVGGFTAGIWG
jgi:hypothetical protein